MEIPRLLPAGRTRSNSTAASTEPQSKLLKGGYIGDYIELNRGYIGIMEKKMETTI